MKPSMAPVNGEDISFMVMALEEAAKAERNGEVPVGAIVVRDGKIIGRGHNRREQTKRPTAHAEILALEEAAVELGSWRLEGCALYVTLEPCLMCAGAIVQSRVARVIFGCLDPKGGAVASLYRALEDPRLNHQSQVTAGVLERDCARILEEFFARLREEKSGFDDPAMEVRPDRYRRPGRETLSQAEEHSAPASASAGHVQPEKQS
jgi:tRNA(adenine34) deaminase